MATKYHVNPNTGMVSPCNAKIKCRFGGASGDENHFSRKSEANKFSEKIMEQKFSPMKSTSRQKKTSFAKNRENLKKDLLASGVISADDKLPNVRSKKEMIDKWFDGDKEKFETISKVNSETSLRDTTKKSVGTFINNSVKVNVVSDLDFEDSGNDKSNVDLLNEDLESINIDDIRRGKMVAFG